MTRAEIVKRILQGGKLADHISLLTVDGVTVYKKEAK